jgi:putative membrane-bound dehydrogenase-like protein
MKLRLLATTTLALTPLCAQEPPKLNDPELAVSLYASEPLIQQPIGMCMDERGRLLVIESHTHFRPKDWMGPEHDQIVILQDQEGDGKAEQRTVFYDQTDMTMDLALHPSGWVYVSTRNEILRLRDEDGDGRAEKVERNLVFLDTESRYPHNGLSGLAFDKNGNLHFGMGENLGSAYTLKAGATELADQGEGGNIFVCTAEGKRLRRVATGFWNPFGVCIDSNGNIFATDNDPDSSPPCRLHHIFQGGDYGYQFRYGRSGLHPFISWNGQLPGTLPMLAGTGEAPCDVIHYAPAGTTSSGGYRGLGHQWHGSLLVASWVDHRIESYRLSPQSGSFKSQRSLLCEGGADFRPVAFAMALDGSLYVSDWVKRDYNLHGHGRVWKIQSQRPSAQAPALVPASVDPDAQLIERIYSGEAPTTEDFITWFKKGNPFIYNAALWRIAREGTLLRSMATTTWADPVLEAAMLQAAKAALRFEGSATTRPPEPADMMLVRGLGNPDPTVVILALKWIADDRILFCRKPVENLLKDSNLTPAVYYAAITTLARLQSPTVTEAELIKLLLGDLKDPGVSPIRKRLALQIIPDRGRHLTAQDIIPLLSTAAADYKVWLLHYLGSLPDEGKHAELGRMALSATESPAVRAAALAHWQYGPDNTDKVVAMLADQLLADEVREAAAQALTGSQLTPSQKEAVERVTMTELQPSISRVLGKSFVGISRPQTDEVATWRLFLDKLPGDVSPTRGRNIFHSPKLGGCALCHRVEGIGSAAGPDLSSVGKNSTPHYALLSLLQPNANVAPQYESYTVVTKDGQSRVAFQLTERGGDHSYADLSGAVFQVKIDDLVSRTALPSSIMPPGLVSRLTDSEVRDLIGYLESLSKP